MESPQLHSDLAAGGLLLQQADTLIPWPGDREC